MIRLKLEYIMQHRLGTRIILKCDLQKLEMVQRAAPCFYTGHCSNTSSVTNMLHNLGLEPLDKRRKINRLLMMHKMIHGLADMKVDDYLQFAKEREHVIIGSISRSLTATKMF